VEPPPNGRVNDDIDLSEVDPKGASAARAKAEGGGKGGIGGRNAVIALCVVGVLLLIVAVYSAHSSSPNSTPAGAASSPSQSAAPGVGALPTGTAAVAGAGASTTAATSASPSASASASSSPAVAVDKAAVRVAVYNGSGVNQRAAGIKSALVTDGFTIATVGGTLAKTATTKIYYPSGRSDSAAAVATALGVPSANVTQSTAYTEVTVIVGEDWTTGNTYPGAASASATP
jgi:LytR cell envelope-related transcriptional attenuator